MWSSLHSTTPPYETNVHWEVTFRALGWNGETLQKFWAVFCRINVSNSGAISNLEFMNFFGFDRTRYVEKCFKYFDTTGGDDIDFFEFMISVWNLCPVDSETLTNFAFDLYDLNSNGEMTLPEVEKMVNDLYGVDNDRHNIHSNRKTTAVPTTPAGFNPQIHNDVNVNANAHVNETPRRTKISSSRNPKPTPYFLSLPVGKQCLKDLTWIVEDNGGVLTVDTFTEFCQNHSMLLFPVFQIQRSIQNRVMGLRYWTRQTALQKVRKATEGRTYVNPRHVQVLLRTYKTGSAATILTHTGDSNIALKWAFQKIQNCNHFPESIEDMIRHQESRKQMLSQQTSKSESSAKVLWNKTRSLVSGGTNEFQKAVQKLRKHKIHDITNSNGNTNDPNDENDEETKNEVVNATLRVWKNMEQKSVSNVQSVWNKVKKD